MDRENISSNNISSSVVASSTKAILELGVLWNIHVYGFAVFFIALTTLLVPSCVTAWRQYHQTSNRLSGSLHVMLVIFALPRAVLLLVDPYLSRMVLHRLAYSVIELLSVPALTSATCTVLLAILDSTRLSLCPPKFQNIWVIIVISVLHYSVYVTTALVTYFKRDASYMVIICHALACLWGITVALGYMIAAYRIRRNIQFSVPQQGPKSTADDTTRRIYRLILCLCAGLGGIEFVTTLYGAIDGMRPRINYAAPLSWWIFQTILRLLEACLSISVLFLASRSNQKGMFPSPWDSLWKTISNRIGPEWRLGSRNERETFVERRQDNTT